MSIGELQFQRYGFAPKSGIGFMVFCSPVRTSKRTMSPPWDSPYTVFGSMGSICLEAVPTRSAYPVGVCNSLSVSRLTRAAPAAVVLQSAIDIVKGQTHVGCDRVVLRDWKIRNEVDGATTIMADVNPAVAADDEM